MAMLVVDGVAIPDPSEFSWGESDISSSDSGRTQDNIMHKNRIGTKVTLKLAWWDKTPEETQKILQAFYPEYVNVAYWDARIGQTTKTFYTGDRSAPVKSWTVGKKRYSKISFDIIER